MSLYIGLMSGTSMDGMDAALVDLSSNTLIAGITRPYSQEVQARLSRFNQAGLISPIHLMQLHTLIGQDFTKAVFDVLNKAHCKPEDIIAIGSHGQTLYHDPLASIPTTLQLGCAHTIAAQTGITTVADFRTRDLVLGGQGAPFAPCYHHILFEKHEMPLVLVNIGGIANITILRKNQTPIGYDTGPGNTLMDAWIKKHRNFDYDTHGDWASTGKIIKPLLSRLLDDAYFKQISPKSIGTEYFSEAWLSIYLESDYLPEDVQATLASVTAISIAHAIQADAPECTRIALCGGGVHNHFLCQQLKQILPQCSIESTQTYGVDPDYLEAIMFGWFAQQTILNNAVNLTQITGAIKPTILGSIYPK
jgi:anhydro-N-acetylmuramic acid kinase